jgi:3-oxoacyl-[acyl-carrier protein] reductase
MRELDNVAATLLILRARPARAAIPISRFGAPARVADAIAFLASSRSGYITGTNVRVDRG